MEFGLFAPRPAIVREPPPVTAEADPWYDFSLRAVTAAERAGFGITLVAQRFLGPDLEAWIQSAALVQATSRIRIMTAIHPIFWSPQVAAKMAASMDRISRGRFEVNLVTGWFHEEQRKYGGLELGGTQYARSEEFVNVMRLLWTDESVTFRGEFYELEDVQLYIRPSRLPQVYTTTRSDVGREMAARICDWWFVPAGQDFRTPDQNLERMRQSVADMRERAARFGRRVRIGAPVFLIHDEDEAAALRHAEELERYGRSAPPGSEHTSENLTARGIQVGGLGAGLVGSRARILDQLARLEEIGVEMVLLRLEPMLRGIEDLAEHVIPYVAAPASAADAAPA